MTPEVEAALEYFDTTTIRRAAVTRHGITLAAAVRAQAEKRCETCARLIVRMDICAKLGGSEYDVTPDQINHVCGLWKRRETL